MTDFSSITDVHIEFLPHSAKSDAHDQLNNACITMLDPTKLFAAPSTGAHGDAGLGTAARKEIADGIRPHAMQASDLRFVVGALARAPLSISCSMPPRKLRLTKEFTTKTLETCVGNGLTEITIHIGMNHVHFLEGAPLPYLLSSILSLVLSIQVMASPNL